ncbi:MAG: ATP pyrophosphatase [Candidatus Bathyarchaeota archaeon]|nr:MAG: ATP pyrophosphatase [Candidatus Bathyarchaeota archaeon]
MKAAALFSGGKDSLYSLYIAEKQGIKVDHLITLITTLPIPSPHAENIEALKTIAKSMGKQLTIVDFKQKNAFIETLKNLNIDALIAGDIDGDDHFQGLKDVCSKTGLELLELIYGRDTTELFNEIFGLGFKALITGVDLNYLGKEWLGFVISKESGAHFLKKIGTADPLGEYGEFHTLVLECPLYGKSFKVTSTENMLENNIAFIKVSVE